MLLKFAFLVCMLGIAVSAGEQVKVSLYFESLCPFCNEFIVKHLYPGYQKLGDNLLIDLVPYGNANSTVRKDGSVWFDCQHGIQECYINMAIACAIDQNKTQANLMKFVNIVIQEASTALSEELIKACEDSGIDWRPLYECLNSPRHSQLLLHYATVQKSLDPPYPQYVPHIRFNDEFNNDREKKARDDFVKTACELFKTKPSACTQYSDFKEDKSTNRKSYLNEKVARVDFM